MFSEADLAALRVTLQLASLTTFVLLVLGTPLAWWLARSRWRFKFLLEAVVALPLVLPPVVTGYLLLVCFGRQGPIGSRLEQWFGVTIVFTWLAAVLACTVVSFPLMVRAIRLAFQALLRTDVGPDAASAVAEEDWVRAPFTLYLETNPQQGQ